MSLNNNNPYNDLLGLMRSEGKYHNPLTPLVGKITKINDNLSDIEVVTHTMPLYKDDLLIDNWLKSKHYNLGYTLGYTCNIKNCINGIVGTVECEEAPKQDVEDEEVLTQDLENEEGEEQDKVYEVKCVNLDNCSKTCEKLNNKDFECEDCTVLCKNELRLDDKLQIDDLVLLVPYEEKFIITSKVVSI